MIKEEQNNKWITKKMPVIRLIRCLHLLQRWGHFFQQLLLGSMWWPPPNAPLILSPPPRKQRWSTWSHQKWCSWYMTLKQKSTRIHVRTTMTLEMICNKFDCERTTLGEILWPGLGEMSVQRQISIVFFVVVMYCVVESCVLLACWVDFVSDMLLVQQLEPHCKVEFVCCMILSCRWQSWSFAQFQIATPL